MSAWVLYPLLGLAAGAVYASIAVGLILVHRGSGVVNLAAGAMAMFPALVYVRLRTAGELVLPVVGISGRIQLGGPWPVWPAFVVAVLVGVLIGGVAYWVIFRRLRDSPAVTRLVASVGLTIVLQGAAVAQVGTATQRVGPILPDRLLTIGDSILPSDRLWLLAVVLAMGAAVGVLYRATRFGLATRAAAENAKGAILMGQSPNRLGLGNWLLAALLASVAGVLMSPISGVNPFNYSLFVVPALAAALAGRLRSIGVAMVAGVLIGMFEGLAVHLVSERRVPDILLSGLDSVVPFVAIVLVLVALGRSIPDRGTILEHRFPDAPKPPRRPIAAAVALAAAVLLLAFGEPSLRLAAITSMMVAIICLSIVLLTGYLGQVSLAQLTLVGFSAFLLARAGDDWQLPFPIAPIVAVVLTTLLGVVISLPALRVRGIQVAIVTLAAAVAIEQLLFRNPSFAGIGGSHVDGPSLFGTSFGIMGDGEYPYRPFGFFVLGLLVASVYLVVAVRRGRVGRRMLAVRANERAAAASGVNVARIKLQGAALSSLVAALAGLVFAYKNVDFSWNGLEASRMLQLLALAYLGGVTSVSGALIAGLLAPSGLLLVMLGSPPAAGQQLVLSGIGLLVVTVRFPRGLAGAGPWLRAQLRPRATRVRRPPSAPEREEIEVEPILVRRY
jgi:branched-subunit amino acid ABC-type transport system permease component